MRKCVKVSYEIEGMNIGRRVEVLEAPTEKDVLNFLYREIGCDAVDIAYLPHGLLAWVGDTSLLEKGNVVCEYGEAPLAGTVIFSKSETTEDGDSKWLDSDELINKAIDMAEQSIFKGITHGNN